MAGSSAALRRLGAELRRLRAASGRTQGDVGSAIGRSHATLVNWEHGKTKLSKSDLVCLLAELRAPLEARKALERLREESGMGSDQWVAYGLPDWVRPLVSFEEDAVRECDFQPVVVPGLLQTEDYARITFESVPQTVEAATIRRWVEGRLRRQRRLTDVHPIRLDAVLTEAALRLEVGGPAVMAAQLQRLLDAANAPNITVRVIPHQAWAHAGIASNFAVLHFAEPELDPPLVWLDSALSAVMVSDPGDVAFLVQAFEDLREAALDPGASVELVAAILAGYRERGGGDD